MITDTDKESLSISRPQGSGAQIYTIKKKYKNMEEMNQI
jgi:hypothetical protein